MTKIVHVVGARPNFVKVAPVVNALARFPTLTQVVVHTGQHYSDKLSSEILSDLELPAPDRYLGVGSGTHAEQTARVMVALEEVLEDEQPGLVVVAGDVNSTLASALTAVKLGIPVGHIEAGLRSGDWTMPEEVNRVVTDRVSELLFTHSPDANDNLLAEGIEKSRIHYVGNTMIDSLRRFEADARSRRTWERHGLREREYVLITLHRPSNVDDTDRLAAICDALAALGERVALFFPVHPRTRERLDEGGLLERLAAKNVLCVDPLGYLDFLSLESGAGAILTDSGGIQEEASALGIACYTFRANTERPITLSQGTNVLIGDDPAAILDVRVRTRVDAPGIPLWDGRAGERVAEILAEEAGVTDGRREKASLARPEAGAS
jgi:UDP-N-acetylglucosamine 2-epimerase (non-hydrolysing)